MNCCTISPFTLQSEVNHSTPTDRPLLRGSIPRLEWGCTPKKCVREGAVQEQDQRSLINASIRIIKTTHDFPNPNYRLSLERLKNRYCASCNLTQDHNSAESDGSTNDSGAGYFTCMLTVRSTEVLRLVSNSLIARHYLCHTRI